MLRKKIVESRNFVRLGLELEYGYKKNKKKKGTSCAAEELAMGLDPFLLLEQTPKSTI